MTARTMKWTAGALAALLLLLSVQTADARPKKPVIELNQQGHELEKKYTAIYESLKKDLTKSLPDVSDRAKANYKKALADVDKAKADLGAAQKQLGSIGSKKGLIGHAKGHWIPKADRGIKAAKDKLKNAKTDAEREAAKKELAGWEKNRQDGVDALKQRTADYEKAKKDEPKFKKQVEQAKRELDRAQKNVAISLKTLRLERTLTSDRLDGKLAKFAVMHHATPRGLAGYAQEGAEQRKHIDRLLADETLMVQMSVAQGAKDGNYGRAIKIYDAILAANPKAKSGHLQRLALGIALEHATPISQRNAEADVDAPKYVDPVARYKHFETAYQAGDLDPYFDRHSAWAYRYVVNGNEPDEILAWGREMLRNYRPDHITTKDDRWRYVALVRTCVRYGSQENKNDKSELQFFQNILMNGGICGRRAFIGRFILRSFGVPTVAKPQKGHAALGRWTPNGWVAVLGAGWNTGWAPSREMAAPDFLAMTQARELGDDYLQVMRGHWIGDVNGEPRKPGFDSGRNSLEFWNSIALNTQKKIIEAAGTKALAAVGEELGEANTSKVKYPFESAKVTEADRKISVDRAGVITIPAAATSSPTKSTGKIRFLDSSLGGQQLTYGRTGGDQDFTYTFDVSKAGKYNLTMRVATPSWKQNLSVIANGKAVEFEMPHTVGLWQTTKPVQVELKQGKNTLTFSRKGVKREVEPKGFSIRDYTLTPVKSSF